jgi:hypothetical protein
MRTLFRALQSATRALHAALRRPRLGGAATALATLCLAAPALASTHHYCSGCTIGSSSAVEDWQAFWLTIDYVHRLSGPSCSTIGAYAHYTDGTYGSEVTTYCSDAVQHGYAGTKLGYGAADNLGAGNYGFNAHVDY